VTIDGSNDEDAQNGPKFYSDRFYLDATIYDDDTKDDSNVQKTTGCCCGVSDPPPLFSRSKLVESLHLKAALMGTFSLEPAALVQEFPSLFGQGATVPTLVLHGKKGWTVDALLDGDEPESTPPPMDEYSRGDDDSHGARSSDDDDSLAGCSIGTQEEVTVEVSKKCRNVKAFASPETKKPSPLQFPETVHFSEILPTWLPPEFMPASYSKAVDPETGTLQTTIIDKRVYRRGVHHPKFMILLEQSGSVVVVVSTSNLSSPVSTEGSWVQRFPKAKSEPTPGTKSSSKADFGAVLANFVQCQMLATAAGQLTAHAFVQRYLNWKSLRDLERLFDYSRAQVHLVATVPGDHEGKDSSSTVQLQKENKPNRSRRFMYGPQRIAHILDRIEIPSMLTDDNDRLIFQPTSFGGDWNRCRMANLLRCYMGDSTLDDHDLLQQLDIVWPTDYFMRQASKIVRGQISPTSVTATDFSLGFASFAESVRDKKIETEKQSGGFLFLSSESFNSLPWECLARMVMFESSVPAQRPQVLTPHFKSYARLFNGKSDYRIRKDLGVDRCEDYFSWFLLTSACLSKGAQGEHFRIGKRAADSDAVSYSNFELGVLFTSAKDRVYCWKPSTCCCCPKAGGKSARLVHLPSPYCFRPAPYVPEEDSEEFCETPYFHEILRDSACSTNMLCTPYGSALAKQYEQDCGLC